MNLGPVNLSVDEIRTGIATIVFVFIPNIVITMLFKYAGPKKDETERIYEVENTESSEGELSHYFSVDYPIVLRFLVLG